MSRPSLAKADARTVKSWLDRGEAVLIDVREADEYAREHIPGARLLPLSTLDSGKVDLDRSRIGVFHCNSGSRTTQAAALLAQSGFAKACQLDGGIQAWKRAGLPVVSDPKAPLPIMRQVQIVAGTLVLLGIVLALLVSSWFMALSAFVGAGLVTAGITGFCGMARLLALLPWNRSETGARSGTASTAG